MEGSPQFSMAGAVFAGLGAKVLVRHVKTGQGSAMSDDAVRGMVQEAHDNGVRLIGYLLDLGGRRVGGRPSGLGLS